MIEIVVYSTNSLLLAGLISILDRQENLRVVNSLLDRGDLSSLTELQPDLLLLEQAAESDWWQDLTQLLPSLNLPAVLLTDSLTNAEMNEYLDLGFKAFLPRLTTADEIIAAINAVILDLIVIHPDFASLREDNSAITPLPGARVVLTSRELEVLQLLAAGLDNKAIALQLQISKHTVKFHLSSIFSKLNVSSRTEAVTLGLRQGLIIL